MSNTITATTMNTSTLHKPMQPELNAVMEAFWTERRPDFVQVQSFDHFLRVRIPMLLGEFAVRFPQNPALPVEHEVRIVGHRLEPPTVPEGTGRPLYPDETGWRRLPYCARLFVDVRHVHRDQTTGHTVEEVTENLLMGEIPILTGCYLCNARDTIGLAGGNHIVDGILNTLILQHTMARNTVVVEELRHSHVHGNVLFNGHIRCGSLASRYQTYMFGINVYTSNHRVTRITVRVPSTNKREVPLILLLLAFNDDAGTLAPGSTCGCIPQFVHTALHGFTLTEREDVIDVLVSDNPVNGSLEAFGNSAQRAALHILNQPSMRRRAAMFGSEATLGHDRSIEDVSAHEILPHIGLVWNARVNKEKLFTMLYTLRRVLRVHFQYDSLDYRTSVCGDEPMYERLETDGQLMEEVFAASLRQVQTAVVGHIVRGRHATHIDLRRAIQNDDMKRKIQFCIRTGAWANPHRMQMGRKCVSQVAGLFNETQSAANSRKAKLPYQVLFCLKSQRPTLPLLIQNHQPQAYGLHLTNLSHKPQHDHRLCAVETPEGHVCGSVKHLALFADVALGITDNARLLRVLVDEGGVDTEGFTAAMGVDDSSLVLLNGVTVGTTSRPSELVKSVRTWRAAGRFPPELGVSHITGKLIDEVRLFTDAGRLLTYYLALSPETGHPVLTSDILAEVKAGRVSFTQLVRDNYVVVLCSQGVANLRVAYSVTEIYAPGAPKYDVCVIHPAGIFGISAAVNIPRAQHNNPLRTMFQVLSSSVVHNQTTCTGTTRTTRRGGRRGCSSSSSTARTLASIGAMSGCVTCRSDGRSGRSTTCACGRRGPGSTDWMPCSTASTCPAKTRSGTMSSPWSGKRSVAARTRAGETASIWPRRSHCSATSERPPRSGNCRPSTECGGSS